MRSSRARTIGTIGALVILLAGLCLTMEAWAAEKAKVERQLLLERAEASRLVSSLEAKLQETAWQQGKLQERAGELTALLSSRDAELAAARARLGTGIVGERTSLDLGSASALEAKLNAKLNAQEAEAASLQERLKAAEAKLAARHSKPFTVEVEEVSWKDMGKVPVWVWWDFPRGIPTGYRLNVRTWMRHIPADKFELRLVNSSNIKQFIPDLPDAFFRVYPLAQSDFVRAAMLALHGGVYMDGDMLLRNDLDVVFKELFDGTTEVIPYLWEHQECRKSFSTNFMAGTKGNALSRGWLGRIYRLMSSKCSKKLQHGEDGQYEFYKEGGCCYTASGEPRRPCYVTFGTFGDRSAHAVMAELDRGHQERRLRMSCISKWKGMAANASGSGGELLWKRLLPGPPEGYMGPIGTWDKVPKKEQRAEMCWREGKAHLRCTQSGLYPEFFERHGYHLFNLNNNDLLSGFSKESELLSSGSVIAELYRLALEGEHSERADPRLEQLPLPPLKVSEHDSAKNKMWGDTKQYKMPWLRT